MDALLTSFFNFDVYRQVLPFLLTGLLTTIGLSALVIPLGVISGLGVALLGTQIEKRWVRIAAAAYVDFFRALPPLVLLIFIYFCVPFRSEEHTSELQSLMRISYAVFCLKKNKKI